MKTFRVKVNGKEYEVEIEEIGAGVEVPRSTPSAPPAASKSAIAATPRTAAAMAQNTAGGKITAPMPGTVLRTYCSVGQSIKKGDTLLVLEAMKMENEIHSPADGKVEEIKISKGQSVDAGDLLVQLTI